MRHRSGDHGYTPNYEAEQIFDLITPTLTASLPKGRRRGDKTADDDSVRSRKKNAKQSVVAPPHDRAFVEKIKAIVL